MSKRQQRVSEQLLCPTLRPLIECCIERAINASEVVDAVRKLFVEVAETELLKSQGVSSESQLEILTGLSKMQVRDYRRKPGSAEFTPGIIAKLLCAWEVNKLFCDETNTPQPLSFKGKNNQFGQLVRSVDKNADILATRKELLRRQLAEVRGERIVRLASAQSYHSMQSRGMNLLYRDIKAISSAVEENVLVGPETRNLHLRTEFDNISPAMLPVIRRWLLKEGERFHKRARAYLAKHDLDHAPSKTSEGGGRVVLGAFSWTERRSRGKAS